MHYVAEFRLGIDEMSLCFCSGYCERTRSNSAAVLQGYILNLFQVLIDRQSWTDEGSVSQRVLRSYLLLFACVRGHPPCVHTATELFRQWKESDGNMRSGVAERYTGIGLLLAVMQCF